MTRQVILFIAMSLDGYIAKDKDNIDFLSIVESAGEDYGYSSFQKEIDTVIWGRLDVAHILFVLIDISRYTYTYYRRTFLCEDYKGSSVAQ